MSDLADRFRESNTNLLLPKSYEDDINGLVQHGSVERENVEQRPFPRKVDFWAFCIATALALDLIPWGERSSTWGQMFVTTRSGIIDDDLSSLLSIVAVAKFGHSDRDAFDGPKIINLGNRLAGAGCQEIFDRLKKQSVFRGTLLDQMVEFAKETQRIGGTDG